MRFSGDYQGRVLGDSREILRDSRETHRRFLGDSRESLVRFSGYFWKIFERLSKDSREIHKIFLGDSSVILRFSGDS